MRFKIKKQAVLLCIFLFILAFAVIAAPPVTPFSSTSSSGLEIKYPMIEYVEINEELKLHFHIFNTTSGMPINNVSTECFFHLYNNSGDHKYIQNVRITDNIFDFDVYLNETNFTTADLEYSYMFQCNSSSAGGFVSVEFFTSIDGKPPKEVLIEGSIPLLIFLIMVNLLLYLLPFFKTFINFELTNNLIKRAFWTVALFLTMFNFSILATVMEKAQLPLTKEMYRYMIFFGYGGYIMLGFTVLAFLMGVLKFYKIKKENKRNGDDENDF